MELCDNDADTSIVRAALAAATDDSVDVSKNIVNFFLCIVAMLLSSEKKSSIVKITL